jgi:hypothetical protein
MESSTLEQPKSKTKQSFFIISPLINPGFPTPVIKISADLIISLKSDEFSLITAKGRF